MNTPGSTPKRDFDNYQFPQYNQAGGTLNQFLEKENRNKGTTNISIQSRKGISMKKLNTRKIQPIAHSIDAGTLAKLKSLAIDQSDEIDQTGEDQYLGINDTHSNLSSARSNASDILAMDFPDLPQSNHKLPELKRKKKKKKKKISKSVDSLPSTNIYDESDAFPRSHGTATLQVRRQRAAATKILKEIKLPVVAKRNPNEPKKMLALDALDGKKKKIQPQEALLPHKIILKIISYLPTHYILTKIRMIDVYWAKKVRKSKSMWIGGWKAFVRQMAAGFDTIQPATNTQWKLNIHDNIPIKEYNGQPISAENLLAIQFTPQSSLIRAFKKSRKLKYLYHWIYFFTSVADRIEMGANQQIISVVDDITYYERITTIVFYKNDFVACISLSHLHLPPV